MAQVKSQKLAMGPSPNRIAPQGHSQNAFWAEKALTAAAQCWFVIADLGLWIFASYVALLRKISIHRRWALRLFLVVNAIWFFRIGIMLWLFIHHDPVGFDPQTFTGPFLNVMAFAQTLLPLALLELDLRVKDAGSAAAKLATAGGLLVMTAAMATGIFAAALGLCLPFMGIRQ